MPWDDLSEPQKKFVTKYLDVTILDRIAGYGTSDATAAVIGSFEDFERARLGYEQAMAAVPAGYPEKTAMRDSAGAAIKLRDAGKFTEAVDIIAKAGEAAQKTLSVYITEAGRLRLIALPVVANANPGEVQEIATLHATITLAGQNRFPDHAALIAARNAEPTLPIRVQEITAAAAKRDLDAARQDFKDVYDPLKAGFLTMSTFDCGGPYLEYSRQTDLQSYVSWAINLLELGRTTFAAEDAATYRQGVVDLADKGNVTVATLDGFKTHALAEFRTKLAGIRDTFESKVKWARDLGPTAVTPAEEIQRGPMVARVKLLLDAAKDALAGTDLQAILDARKGIEASTDATAMVNFYNAVLLRKSKAGVLAKGVSEEQFKGMEKLFVTSNTAYNAVNDVLTKASAKLGDVVVTPAFLDTKRDIAATEQKKHDDLTKAKTDVEKLHVDAAGLETKADDGLEGLKIQLLLAEGDDQKRIEGEIVAATETLKLAKAEAARLKLEAETKANAVTAQAVVLTDAKDIVKAAESKKGVLDAINHGPLAEGQVKGMSDATRAEICKAYSSDPRLGAQATDAVARAVDPEAVGSCMKAVNARVAPEFSQNGGVDDPWVTYAERLVSMSANLDKASADRLDDYLVSDRHFNLLPELTGSMTTEARGQANANHVSKGMVDGNGDFDPVQARENLDDIMFNPNVLRHSQPNLVKHMGKTLDFFEDTPSAQQKVKDITAPVGAGGKELVANSCGKTADTVGVEDARQSVLTAMLTPVRQGPIGSCFSTASVIKLRDKHPEYTLETFVEMVEEGVYRPEDGDELAVISNLPDGENPLVRSLEYTAATASARKTSSRETMVLGDKLSAGFAGVSAKFKPTEPNALPTLVTTVTGEFSCIYDPKAAHMTVASDGSSKFGRYVLLRLDTGASVNSKTEFTAALRDIVAAQIDTDDLADTVTVDDVIDLVVADGAVDVMKINDKFPWELGTGGFGDDAAMTIIGEQSTTSSLVPGADPTTSVPKERTMAIVKALLNGLPGGSDDLATIETFDHHTFNALPNDKSLDELRSEGPGKINEKLEKLLVDKGTELRDTEISTEKAAYIFDKTMTDYADSRLEELREPLLTAIKSLRPTTPLKPAQLDTLIKSATAEFTNKVVEHSERIWKEGLKKDGKPDPTVDEVEKHKVSSRKSVEVNVANISRNALCKALAVPEIVLADTNWGGPGSQTLFIVAPDPITGDPMMFERIEPPGTLTPLGKDWLDQNWVKLT